MKYVARVRGAVNEPLWRNMLGVVKYTTEGEPLCHEWSQGDPRYDEEETQRKIDKWTAGPTLCETLRASSDLEMPRLQADVQIAHPTWLLRQHHADRRGAA